MKDFVINRHNRLVFPCNVWPRLDFSVFDDVGQLGAAIGRDFEAKAPSASQIVGRVESGEYATRYQLVRDLGLHAFWVNRFALTMYDKRPTRWRDVPRGREGVFLPVLTPWPGFEHSVAVIERGYRTLPPGPDTATEQKIFDLIFGVFTHLRHDAAELPAIKPTVAEFLARAQQRTFAVAAHQPDWRLYSQDEIIDAASAVPELEPLLRWAMVLHNQYPWASRDTRIVPAGEIADDDFVVLFYPRDQEVLDFIQRAKAGRRARRPLRGAAKPAGAGAPGRRVSPRRGRRAVQGHAAGGVAGGRDRGVRLHQHRHHPEFQLELVADDRGRHRRQDGDRAADLHPPVPGRAGRRCRPWRAGPSLPGAGGDRRRAVLYLHQPAAHPVHRHPVVRRARHVPDARLG